MSNEEGQRLTNSMAASSDKANQARQDMASNLQQSESYRRTASFAQENAVNINSDASQAFFQWVQNQPGTNGTGRLGASGVEYMQQHDPVALAGYAKQFSEQYSAKIAHGRQGQQAGSPAAVQAAHERHVQSIPSEASVAQSAQAHQEQIQKNAGSVGLGQGSIVDPSVKQGVAASMDSAKNQIAHHKQGMHPTEKMLQTEIKKELNKPLKTYSVFKPVDKK